MRNAEFGMRNAEAADSPFRIPHSAFRISPALSVVVPVYNEAGNAVPLCTEICEVLDTLGRPFEVIFVNDGSTDDTLAQLRAAASSRRGLRILDLDGNFGEAAALCAGFQAARAPLLITLDGDGQNDPHDIPRLLDTLEGNGFRAVSGWRQQRQEGFVLRVLPSRLANRLIAIVSGIPLHDNGCGLKIYRRDVVDGAALPRGMNRFMPAIFGVRANEVTEVPVTDRHRQHGTSHYGISRTLVVLRDLLALRCIISASQRYEQGTAVAGVLAVAAVVFALRQQQAFLALLSTLAAVVLSMVWWNLRRFNRARADGVFRLRREYSLAEGLE